MKNIFKVLSVVILCLLLFNSFIKNDINKNDNNNNIDFVPNEETAIKIAEAIWFPIYGESIYKKRPFKAVLIKEVWIVQGTLQSEMKGGVPYIEIQKKDCKILKVTHGK